MSVSALQWDIDGSGYHGRHPRADMEREEHEEDMHRLKLSTEEPRFGARGNCFMTNSSHRLSEEAQQPEHGPVVL
jgi:hypothetical protein